jgi:pyruvate,water dikinase
MKELILSFGDKRADLNTVGGKGMSLARMAQAGLPVPDGFLLTTSAYRVFVDVNSLQDVLDARLAGIDGQDPARCDQASAEIQAAFMNANMPAEVSEALLTAYRHYSASSNHGTGIPVAVRSSATAEDLPGASFAGQQDTYLNITGAENLLDAVRRCWASLWTARAISYRLKNNIDQKMVTLAVVVQQMVFADAAGVLFTANPVNGNRGQALINAAWGLGESVVSGSVSPDTITVDHRKNKILTYEIADKAVMTIRTDGGTLEQPVPESLRKQPVLTHSQALELTTLGGRIEALYEVPLDVEWVLQQGRFQIVQARPITTLPPEWRVPVKGAIYARGSLAEHIPAPVTPLFATLGLNLANRATRAMWERVMGGHADILFVGEGFYQPINGFVYGGMKLGPKEMIYAIQMSFSQIGPMFHGSVERWQRARLVFKQVVDDWEMRQPESLKSPQLLEGIQTVFGAACTYFTEIQTCLPAASMSEVIYTRYYNALIKRRDDPEATVLLLGTEPRSLLAEKSLFELAAWIREQAGLAGGLNSLPNERVLQTENPVDVDQAVWAEWLFRFNQHRSTFGKTVFDFDFSNSTLYENPDVMLDALRAYLGGRASNPFTRQQAANERAMEARSRIVHRTIPPLRGWFVDLLDWARHTNPMREDSIADMGMGHPVIRRMLAELGRRLTVAGALKQPEQIYWLEENELIEAVGKLMAGELLVDLTGTISSRQVEWQQRRRLTAPVMLPERSGWSKVIHEESGTNADGRVVLQGLGTSSGSVSGRACILLGPEDFINMKPGDILVAVTTTPAWTPLFALASAVVTEIGGPLSHSSIVAREYNIPAVMAVRGVTHLVQNGQILKVDGLKGTVQVEA